MLRKCNAWVICILFGLGIITASAWRDTTEDSSLKPEPQKKTSAPTIEDSAKEEVATVESIGQSSIDSAKKELANVESIGQSSFDSAKKGVATVENIGQSLVTHPQETISASAKQGLITAKAGEIIAESATQEAENVLNESAKEGSKILQSAEEKAKKVEKKVEFFITTWKFSSNPTVACLLCGCLLLFLFLFIRSCWLRFRSASYSSDGRRTGKKVGSGTVLVCVAEEDEEAVEIYADFGSEEIIGTIEPGEKIVVVGGVVDHEGSLMVPIQPEGIVALHRFKEEGALSIESGTLLNCNCQDGLFALVFDDNSSNKVVGKIDAGETVVARRRPEWSSAGHCMVPVRPQGAVELAFFDIKEGVAEDETLSDILLLRSMFASEETRPEDDEKMKALKKQRTKILLEQAARKQKLENIIQAMLEHEAEKLGKSAPTRDEVRQKTRQALRNANMATQRSAMKAVAYAAPMVTKSHQIYAAVETRVQTCHEKGVNFVLEESKDLAKEMQKVLAMKDATEVDYNILDDINIPSLATILASLFAPVQLRLLFAANKALFWGSVIFCCVDILVLIADYSNPCMNTVEKIPDNPTMHQFITTWWKDATTNHIYLWFLIDGVVHFNCFLVRLPVIYFIGQQLAAIDHLNPHDDPLREDDIDNTDSFDAQDIVVVIKRLIEFYMNTGFSILQQLDLVLRSYAVFLANFSVLFDVLWISYGTYLMWNTPFKECADIGIIFLRVRSTIFLSLFILYLVQVVVFLAGQIMQSEGFSVKLIRLGDSIDEGLQLGIPIAQVVLHALVIRQSSDMIAIQLNMHKTERERLRQKQQTKMKQLSEVNSSIESTTKAVEQLEYDFDLRARSFKDAVVLQEEFERTRSRMTEKAEKFAQEVSDRSIIATRDAEKLLDEWENGEGPEALTALARGDGVSAAVDILMQEDESVTTELDDEAKSMEDVKQSSPTPPQIGSQDLASVFAQASALAETPGETSSSAAQIRQGVEQAEDHPGDTIGGIDETRQGETVGGTEETRGGAKPDEGAGG